MNPLAKALLIILCIIIAFLLVWLTMIKPILYPKFKGIKKQITIYDSSTRNVIFKGYREVILYNSKVKESVWSNIFKGKKLYIIDSNIKDPIVFRPVQKGNSAYIKITNPNYQIDMNPITKIGTNKIRNVATKTDIIIK